MLVIYFALIIMSLNDSVFGNCPSGGEIYTVGISNQGATDVLSAHNFYRNQIMNGQVSGQPKGKNLKTMVYDTQLGEEARPVSLSCNVQHIIANDPRWNWVGQNIFATWSSEYSLTQDWNAAVQAWFSEEDNFIYPNTSNGVTGHYTQVVWANSDHLGCDFCAFYDTSKPQFPYGKLYTCNYGPGGNFNGEAPYERA